MPAPSGHSTPSSYALQRRLRSQFEGFMATYTIRRHGRTPNMQGFTLVALENVAEERVIIVFQTEKQAQEAVALLNEQDEA